MNMPKFIQIIGPQAVGKMTVGQELAKITGYKLLDMKSLKNFLKAMKKVLSLQDVSISEITLKKKKQKLING